MPLKYSSFLSFNSFPFHLLQIILSGVQISFRRLTKVSLTSKFWLKLTDVNRHCRKVGHMSTT